MVNEYRLPGVADCQLGSVEGHQALLSSSTGGPDWQHIDVADCQLEGVQALYALRAGCHGLQHTDVAHCQPDMTEGFQALWPSSTGGPDWPHLDVADCELGSVDGLQALWSSSAGCPVCITSALRIASWPGLQDIRHCGHRVPAARIGSTSTLRISSLKAFKRCMH